MAEKDNPMPDQEVALGTAAKDDTAAAPDTNRYYYPPGATEPQLRPEFANASTPAPAAEEEEEQDLESLKKAELVEKAEDKGLEVKSGMTKADIIDLIESEK